MTKKVLAVVMALVMMLCVVPFAAFADEPEAEIVSSETRVDGWNQNFGIIIDRILDNESSAHWKYVCENNEELANTMLTYTVFALYDDAWKNGFDQSVSIDTAKNVLVTLIEKVDANIGESKVAEIIKVLETATSLNDLLQKVNSYVEISDVLTSSEWTTAFKYIEWAIKAGKLYEEQREEVIQAYARILSVQAANAYYKEFLQYLVDNCPYGVVKTAAADLIVDIENSVEDLIKDEILNATGFTASRVLETAAQIAMETNAYTAVALKVYQVGTSVADFLWNTSDQYVLMDELYTTFYAETCAVDWAKEVLDKDRFEFALVTALTLRQVGTQTLCDLKVAQLNGFVGKVKSQLGYNLRFEYASELAFLDLAKYTLIDVATADYKPVTSIVSAYTSALFYAGDTKLGSVEKTVTTDEGYFTNFFNDYTSNFTRVSFLTFDGEIEIKSDENTLVTLIIEKFGDNGREDWSFTNVNVGPGKVIKVDTTLADKVYTVKTADGEEEFALNDAFEYPDYTTKATAKTVTKAVVNVAEDEINSRYITLRQLIDRIFGKIGEALKSAFSWFRK